MRHLEDYQMNEYIRKTTTDDIAPLTQLFLDTYRQPPWNETWDIEFARLRLFDFVVNPIAENYVLCSETGDILGALFGRRNFYQTDKELYVDEFFICASLQKKGYGTLFLQLLSDILKPEGYSYFILNTEKDYPSEKFYLKNGFVQKESNIFMYKQLT
jgi:GNAT superfamily N-acetyltransferase